MCSFGFFLSSAPFDSSLSLSSSLASASSEAASPLASSSSLSSSSDLSSASLSGAPNGLAGLSLFSASPGLPKLLRRGPDRALPPNALVNGLDLNTDPPLCPFKPANGEVAAAEPKLSFGGAEGAPAAWAPRRLLIEEVPEDDPNRLGFPEPPRAPNGEADELASFANAEPANADADVCGFSVADPVESLASDGCSMLDLGDALADRGS